MVSRPLESPAMTDFEPEEDLPPVAHVIMVYNGPVAPHWQMKVRYGDQKMLDEFWTRVNARLLLLPKHDPQFRRNRERVNRDAERERIICDWDLGEDDAESTSTPTAAPAAAPVAEEVPAADDSPAEEPVAQAETEEAQAAEEVVQEVAQESVPTDEAGGDVDEGSEAPAGQA